jgi:hypothetical protein
LCDGERIERTTCTCRSIGKHLEILTLLPDRHLTLDLLKLSSADLFNSSVFFSFLFFFFYASFCTESKLPPQYWQQGEETVVIFFKNTLKCVLTHQVSEKKQWQDRSEIIVPTFFNDGCFSRVNNYHYTRVEDYTGCYWKLYRYFNHELQFF